MPATEDGAANAMNPRPAVILAEKSALADTSNYRKSAEHAVDG